MSFKLAVVVVYGIWVLFLSLFLLLFSRLTLGKWAFWQVITVAAIVSIFPVVTAARKTRERYRNSGEDL